MRRLFTLTAAIAATVAGQPAAAGVGLDPFGRYDGLTHRALTIEVPPARYQVPLQFLLRVVENVELVCPSREANEAVSACAVGSVIVTPSPCHFPMEGYAMSLCDRQIRDGRSFVVDSRPAGRPVPDRDPEPCPAMPEYYATLMCHESAHVLGWKHGDR